MAKLLTSRLILACAAAGLLAACDTGAEDTAQAEPPTAAPASEADLTGTLLRDLAGERVPAVTVVDLQGNEMALAEAGEPMLVNLWATWCAPCVVEMPLLDDLAQNLDGQVRVVTISQDFRGAEVVAPFFEANDLPNLPSWMDTESELAFAFGGGSLPLTILYDAEGREVWRVLGAYDWGSEEARAQVLEAL